MIRIASLRLVTIIVLSLTSLSIAQEEAILPLGDLNEQLENTARISGNIVSGFTAMGSISSQRPFLEAFIPSSWSGENFCVALVSDDGLYEGSREFRVQKKWQGGILEIPLNSKFDNYLANTNDDQFATLVTKGLCGAGRSEISSARWNEKVSKKINSYQILLNSYRADEVYLIINEVEEVSCIEIDSSKRTAFDYKCQIPNNYMAKTGMTQIEINRVRRGVFDPALLVLIATD